ncbi:villin [Trifolium repens]|nr:villin [Trifolium repens]
MNIIKHDYNFVLFSHISNFDSWPSVYVGTVAEDGRGKVTALLKQQGMGVIGMAKSTPVNDEISYLLEEGGKSEVWRIDGSANEDIGKFHSGNC